MTTTLLKSIEGLLFLCFYTNYNIKSIYNLLEKYNSIDELSAQDSLTQEKVNQALIEARQCISKAFLFEIKILTFYDDEYPQAFNTLKDPPPVLFIKGHLYNMDFSAVIGSRKTTAYGEKITKRLVQRLVENNFGVVSGLAEGIDTFAHKASLEFAGYTIAIIPTPLDKIYPTSNYQLAADIVKSNGCLISEFPFGINKGKQSFIMRNRLVSALSTCVFPIELSEKSGTMHTVNFAIEQNKKLLVLEPSDEYKNKSKETLSGVIKIIDNINRGDIQNAAVIANEEELRKTLLSNKIFNDRMFKNKAFILYEKKPT